MMEEIGFEIVDFRKFDGPVTSTLTFDDLEYYIVRFVSSTSIHRRFSQLWRPRDLDLDLRWPWILYRSICLIDLYQFHYWACGSIVFQCQRTDVQFRRWKISLSSGSSDIHMSVMEARWKISLSSGSSDIHMSVMEAVCCMAVIENTFYYPFLQSNPTPTSLSWFQAFKNPRENAVWAELRSHKTKTKPEFQKNGPTNFRYLSIVYESSMIFEVSHEMREEIFKPSVQIKRSDSGVASIWGVMGAVCCIIVVDDTFYYPSLPSNPCSDVSELI